MVIPSQWGLLAESEKPNQLCVLPPGRRPYGPEAATRAKRAVKESKSQAVLVIYASAQKNIDATP